MVEKIELFVDQLKAMGLMPGDTVLVHSSFKSLGINDPEVIIQSLQRTIGENGTLLMPALSYEQEPHHIHSTNETPTCVGFLSEYFRKRPGTQRSIHPTHSVCGVGAKSIEFLGSHRNDHTPCGANSPFNKILHQSGKILMIGCSLESATVMHAIEEYIQPPYLFAPPVIYTITDADGRTFKKEYIPHNFSGYTQKYDRLEEVLSEKGLHRGIIRNAKAYMIDCQVLYEKAMKKLERNPLYFVDQKAV